MAAGESLDGFPLDLTAELDLKAIHPVYRQKDDLEDLAGLVVQAMRLRQTAGLVNLGHVALDGTKVKARASKLSGEGTKVRPR